MKNCPDKNPLQRDGLSQFQRRLAALQPDYISVDERTMEDLLRFAADYAEKAKPLFFNLDGTNDFESWKIWKRLMDSGEQLQNPVDLAATLANRSDIEPHFALFLCFLQLFALLQNDINTITKRHLDYYYKEVLRLDNRAPVADRVHVLFTLAKNAADQIVAENTELDAGKDELRQPLIYPTLENLTVNAAAIGHLRTVFVDASGTGKVFFAPAANTADGIDKPLNPGNPAWNAFGPKPVANLSCVDTPSLGNHLPEAQLGFALASPVLLLAEGTRRVTLRLTVDGSLNLPAGLNFKVEFSGKKAWLSPASDGVVTRADGNVLEVEATLSADVEDAVVNFDPAKLDGGYATEAPVMRCWLADSRHYRALRGLTITNVSLEVQVTGLLKTLQVSNDLGDVNPEKPFMPFGPAPTSGATLYVGSPEMENKTLRSLSVGFREWVGKPDFSSHYSVYGGSYTNENNFLATATILRGNLKGQDSGSKKLFSEFTSGVLVPPTPVANVFVFPVTLTGGIHVSGGHVFVGNLPLAFAATPANPEASGGHLFKIQLGSQQFGHGVYPKLLSETVTHNVIYQHDHPLPNTPYTPLASDLQVSYTAEAALSIGSTDFATFSQRPLQFFHLGVFGAAEEHAFLKQGLAFLPNAERNSARLLPYYTDQGTFLIGLQNLEPLEAISLLFQVAEGSANPERQAPFVAWSVLSQNQWRGLGPDEVLSDATNNLLTSGITKFLIPTEASTANNLLETSHVWLKAELWPDKNTPNPAAPHDSVCNLVALHPQAVLARFSDRANDPAHYDQPLAAGSIQKSRSSLASIKKIEQPYASFGGAPRESDAAYYTRVSERLRHKQRAVTIWDYEHLVLQTFPSVFKAKCLNHTRLDLAAGPGQLDELAPGHVTLVVLPDLRNANAINPLEPKVDLNTLDNILDFLQKHAAKFVGIQVSNPLYERVRFTFKVQFARGFEPAVYQKKLNEDLVRYLSPWAFDTAADVPFGGAMQKSVIINFMERLPYVDFLTDVQMTLPQSAQPAYDHEEITASSPMSVLVSCSKHDIRIFDFC